VNIHCSRDPKKGIVNNQKMDWSFKLDGIMHNASQEAVFNTAATDVITAALDGYNGNHHHCFTSDRFKLLEKNKKKNVICHITVAITVRRYIDRLPGRV